MNIRKSSLTVAIAALMSVGLVGQAAAYTSAGSVIEYQNLQIVTTGIPFQTVASFNFVTTNTATLNGDSGIDSDQCGGIPFVGDTCNQAQWNGNVLDSTLITKGTTGHVENDFTLDGPNAGTQYSYADSVIETAELTPVPGQNTTKASIIAETELLTTGGGNSLATIQSTTGFSFQFTVGDSGTLTISFQADPDAYSASDNPGSILTLAESSVAAVVTLTKNDQTASASWAPNGIESPDDGTSGCSGLSGGVTCSDETDQESLNEKTGVTSDPAYDPYSMDAQGTWSNFSITMNGLASGDWTFTLTTTVANSVTKIAGIPEPGIVMLLGMGMAGLAVARRRKKA
jgi:hypothetical protein